MVLGSWFLVLVPFLVLGSGTVLGSEFRYYSWFLVPVPFLVPICTNLK